MPWRMDARAGFRVVGEQIAGSFQHGGDIYLLEAKWHRAKTDANALRAFQGKVDERLEGTRGLFVSFSGYTDVGLQAFTARKIILADGMDIYDALAHAFRSPTSSPRRFGTLQNTEILSSGCAICSRCEHGHHWLPGSFPVLFI
jgi:hypothetical protein